MNLGLDYGNGQTNIDKSNGIRYGVISSHDICQAWYDSCEPYYGQPTCPKCGNMVSEHEGDIPEDWEVAKYECADYACADCQYVFGSESAYPEEPLGYVLNDGDYMAEDCLDSDVIVTKSPYYTYAQFCSPCVPGAGNLNNYMGTGAKTYCFGHDWFEDEVAPYPVYRVSDDSFVMY